MKRGFVKILILLLTIAALAVGLAACAGDGGEESDIYVIADFESDDELMDMNYFNDFGLIKTNKESAYIKNGEGSAYAEVHGDPLAGAGAKPYLVIYNNTPYNDKTDYTNVEEIRFSAYNDSDRDIPVYFQFKSASLSKSGYSSEQAFTLKKGQWNEVSVPIDRALLNTFIDLDQISEFYLKFDNRTADQTPAKVYLDYLVAVQTDEPIPTGVKVREDNELESADRAEYLSAWETSNGATLSLNTDPAYILQGEGSFKWTGAAAGGTSWPRLDFTGNIVADISQFDYIYFWIYNANPDDYSLVTGGKTPCGTAVAGEWSLIEMAVDWIANVPTFDDSGFEYDVKNFTNFNMVVTNPNKDLTFYIDAFYGRKADEEVIGTPEPAADIELDAEEELVQVKAGATVAVPAVTNADDYTSVSWRICRVTQESGSVVFGDSTIATDEEEFTTLAGSTTMYNVIYSAEDAQGRKTSKTYSVLAVAEGVEEVPATTGCEDGLDAYQTTWMDGDYAEPTFSVSEDEKYNIYGSDSVAIHFAEDASTKNYAFTWKPGFNVSYCDSLVLFFYNDSDVDRSVDTAWGLNIVLKAHRWTAFDYAKSQIIAHTGNAPEVHSYEDLAISFKFNGVSAPEAFDIYMDVAITNPDFPEETDELLKLPATGKSAAVGGTFTIKEDGTGSLPFPEVKDGAQVTWKVTKYTVAANINENADQRPVATELGSNVGSFTADEAGIYVVEYTAELNDETYTLTYSVLVDNKTGVAMNAGSCTEFSGSGSKYPDQITNTTETMFGNPVLRANGAKGGFFDVAFWWDTGVRNEIEEISIYVYNNSDADVNISYGWGMVQTLYKGRWNMITMVGVEGWANGNGSQVRRSVDNVWSFLMSHNVADVKAQYDLRYVCTVSLGELPAETTDLELDEYVGYGTVGTAVTVPAPEGASFKVYRDNVAAPQFDGQATFTPDVAGVYEVRYTKPVGEEVQTAVYTLFVEESGYTAIIPDAEDISKIDNVGNEFPTTFEPGEKYNALHVEGQRVLYQDIGFVWNSGLTEAMDSIVFYVYNDTDEAFTMQHSWGVIVTLAPHSWTRVLASCIQGHIDGYKPDGSGSQAGKNEAGEYLFYIPVKIADNEKGTGLQGGETYSLYVAAAYKPNAPAVLPETDLELDEYAGFGTVGTAVTVPAPEGASFKVYRGGTEVSQFNDQATFTPDAAGVYEIKYSKTVGGEEQTATYTLFVEESGYTAIIPDAEDIFKNESGNEYPAVFEADETYNALHVEGQRVLMPDIGFVWNSGLTEAMDSIVFYIYNDTDATMSVQHSWGVVVTLAPHSWTRIEASCIQGHIDGYKPDGSGSQAGKNEEGEYFFFIPVKIAGVAEGATNIEGGETYSLYVFASYRPNAPEVLPETDLELDELTGFGTVGTAVTVPAPEGASFKVYRDGAEVSQFNDLATFTPDVAGVYEIKYSKTVGGEEQTATFTLFVEESGYTAIIPDAEDMSKYSDGNEYPAVFEADETYNALHVEGQRILYQDMGFVWNSGLTEAMDSIVFYVYNDTDQSFTMQHSWGVVETLAPHSWTRMEAACSQGHIDGYNPGGNGSQAGKNEAGEYLFYIPVKIAGFTDGTGLEGGETYSLYVFAAYKPN